MYTNKDRYNQNPNPRFLQWTTQNDMDIAPASGLVVGSWNDGWKHMDQQVIETHARWSCFTQFWPAIAIYALVGRE